MESTFEMFLIALNICSEGASLYSDQKKYSKLLEINFSWFSQNFIFLEIYYFYPT